MKKFNFYDYFETAIYLLLSSVTIVLILASIVGMLTRNNLPMIAY